MSTIKGIDKNHMQYHIGDNSASQIFIPEQYKTYGAARKAIRDLMNGIGYESLTQTQKEIVGRWSLITDQDELDELFSSNEQEIITQMHQSQFKIIYIISQTTTFFLNTSYKTINQLIYNGEINNEILSIKVVSNVYGSGNYSIRIFDTENVQIIAEKTGLTNNTSSIIDLGNILFQPTNNTILDIQIKEITGINKVVFRSSEIQYL